MEFKETVRSPFSFVTIVKFGHRMRVHAEAPVAKHQQLLQSSFHLVPATQDGVLGVLGTMVGLFFVLRSDRWYSL